FARRRTDATRRCGSKPLACIRYATLAAGVCGCGLKTVTPCQGQKCQRIVSFGRDRTGGGVAMSERDEGVSSQRTVEEGSPDEGSVSRRKALGRLGRYVAPAMLALLVSEAHAGASVI